MTKKLKNYYYNFLKFKNKLVYGKPVLVMMYHRINEISSKELNHLTVSTTNFEQQLILFKENFQILKVEDDWSSLKKTGLVVTFDDGYADNMLNALPLLEKHQIPATIFVTTLNINTKNEFWWDRLSFDYNHINYEFNIPGNINMINKDDYSYKKLSNIIAKLSTLEIEKWLFDFENLNNINFKPRDEYRSLTSDELFSLSIHPLITIGIHTENHYYLGELNFENQKKELLLSLEKLRNSTHRFINYLAFPYGSYNADSLLVNEELNINGSFLANNYYTNNYFKKSKKISRIIAFDYKKNEMIHFLKKYH